MKQAQKRSFKKGAANSFGYLGYVSCFLQWLWSALLYLSVIQSTVLFVAPAANTNTNQYPSFAPTLPDPAVMIIVSIVVVVMVIITIFALVKLPMEVAKNSNKIVHKASQMTVPMVIKMQHKKDTKKDRILLMPKVVMGFKIVLVVIPAVLAALSGLLTNLPIDYSIVMIVGGGLACCSILFFGIQYMIAKLARIAPSHLK